METHSMNKKEKKLKQNEKKENKNKYIVTQIPHCHKSRAH